VAGAVFGSRRASPGQLTALGGRGNLPPMRRSWLVIAALTVAVPHTTRAQPPGDGADYAPAPSVRDIVVVIPGERSPTNIAWLAGVTAAGVVAGAIGLYYNLDSKSAADAVSQNQQTGRVWGQAYQADIDRA